MTEEIITLSQTEIDRISVIQSIINRRLTQAQAAQQLKLSIRQIKRLTRAYRTCGATGLASKRRGRCPCNIIGDEVRQQALLIIKARYIDFGPTFAHEKLTERHDCHFSVETLRKWMIGDGLWLGKQRKKAAIHQSRPRRSRLGELVQIDGSPHDWFEGRAPYCTLIVFIDDATSRLLALRFAPTETTQTYMETLGQYLDKQGRPGAMYSDKHSIFRVNHPDKEGELTQFTRALKTLDIEPIHANTQQAYVQDVLYAGFAGAKTGKGRVERANKTATDRLLKEMRLQGINSIEQANAFLPQFIDDYNRRFAVTAHYPDNAHRAVLHSSEALKLILSLHHQRKLSKNLTIQFRNTEYQLLGLGKGYRLRGATVTVCEDFNGQVTLLHKGKTLAYRTFQQGEVAVMIVDDKTVHNHVEPCTSPTTKIHMETRTRSSLAATINPFFNQHCPIMNTKRGHLNFGLTPTDIVFLITLIIQGAGNRIETTRKPAETKMLRLKVDKRMRRVNVIFSRVCYRN